MSFDLKPKVLRDGYSTNSFDGLFQCLIPFSVKKENLIFKFICVCSQCPVTGSYYSFINLVTGIFLYEDTYTKIVKE